MISCHSLTRADHSLRDTWAGVACGLRGQVVFFRVDDDAAADDGDSAAAQAEVFDDEVIVCVAAGVGDEIAEIASVMVL